MKAYRVARDIMLISIKGNSHLKCIWNPFFSLNDWSIKLSSVSLLGIFRAVPLPLSLTLPLPLNRTPPPASIYGNLYPGFPRHFTGRLTSCGPWQPSAGDVCNNHSNSFQEASDSYKMTARNHVITSYLNTGHLGIIRLGK